MSWNEPGSPKKDPWSGRDQQPSPPDLEEVLRSIQERVGRLFEAAVAAAVAVGADPHSRASAGSYWHP
jgi:membrane protease subunit HflK